MLPPTLGIAVHLFDRMAFGGQWQYNVPSQWLVDADDDDKDADGRNLIEGCDADHGQDMGDYGLLLQMKMNVVMMAIMQVIVTRMMTAI